MGGNIELFMITARDAATKESIDISIFFALIEHESHWDAAAISGDGAIGIAQIMPNFHPAVNPRNPQDSLFYAARLIRSYLDFYHDSYEYALSAYNVGSPTVSLWSFVPQWEMNRYVLPILARAQRYRSDETFLRLTQPKVLEPVADVIIPATVAIETPTPSREVPFAPTYEVADHPLYVGTVIPAVVSPTPTPTPIPVFLGLVLILVCFFRAR